MKIIKQILYETQKWDQNLISPSQGILGLSIKTFKVLF